MLYSIVVLYCQSKHMQRYILYTSAGIMCLVNYCCLNCTHDVQVLYFIASSPGRLIPQTIAQLLLATTALLKVITAHNKLKQLNSKIINN